MARPAALPERLAVVAGHHQQRVAPARRRRDGGDEVGDRVVEGRDLAVVGVDHAAAHRAVHLGGGRHPYPGRRGDGAVGELLVVGRRRVEVPVRVHVEEEQEQRLLGVAAGEAPEPEPGERHALRVAGADPGGAGVRRHRGGVVVPDVEPAPEPEPAVGHGVGGHADRLVAGVAQRAGEGGEPDGVRRVGADAQVDARLDRGEERHHRRLRP